MNNKTTDFGFTKVEENQKASMVADVFHSVAKNYDIMNDVMSMGAEKASKSAVATMELVREAMGLVYSK
jgi:demethylmenaquinone methyltransferase/2-methoxy-6-polyprenyl-1,4-benzoquinol methylase